MEPMKPMKPMEPMKGIEAWWDEHLGHPDSAGGQNDAQYAYFANSRRLLFRRNGIVSVYDTGDHRIHGVAQSGDSAHPRFTSDRGVVDLASLRKVES